MTDPAAIFRDEALRYHEGGSGPGEVLRVSPRWAMRAYWAVLALVVAGLACAALIRVGQFARGPAVVRGPVVEAVVPAAFTSQLRPGMPLMLTLRGRPPVTVAVESTGPEVAGADAAGRLLGTDVSGAGLPPGPLLAVQAPAPRGVPGGTVADASIKVGSQPLIATLVPGLQSLLDGGGG